MDNSSVYKYFRPIIVSCCLVGHFSITNVTATTSEHLKFKRFSVPVLVFIFSQLFIIEDILILMNTYENTLMNAYHVISFSFGFAFSLNFLCSSSSIIKGLNSIDRLRNTFHFIPTNVKPTITNPMTFSRLMNILFVLNQALSFSVLITDTKNSIFLSFQHFFKGCGFFRQSIVLCCIYHCCSLVVQDSIQAWHHFCWSNCRPFSRLHDFCLLVMAQRNTLSMIHLNAASIAVAWSLFYRTTFALLLIYCMNSTVIQFDKFSQEVLAMAVQDMSWRDYSKVRVLLTQMESNPGEFTAARFIKVDPSLMLAFLSLGIEYFIMFIQNVSHLREVFGLSSVFSESSNNRTLT